MKLRRDAVFSADGNYRYRLSRHWREGPEATFIMLNPSTADAEVDDPTIRRCMGFARLWGMGGLYVGNLFAYRATRPTEMKKASDPIGPDNFDHLQWMCERAKTKGGLVLCAWGRHGRFRNQDRALLHSCFANWQIQAKALLINRDGTTRHPLYVPAEVTPVDFRGPIVA